MTARLTSLDAFTPFKDALTSDPRVTVQVDREPDYYDRQSRQLTTLITAPAVRAARAPVVTTLRKL